MKKSSKKDRAVEERDKPLPAKKRSLKPWRLDFKIVDPNHSALKEDSWLYMFQKGVKLNVWIRDPWEKFVSLEQAFRELNKSARSYNFKQKSFKDVWKYQGREFRLVNIDTEEIVPLTIGDIEIYAA